MNVLQSIYENRFESKQEKLSLKETLRILLEKECVLVGSYAWNVETEESDYDIVCTVEVADYFRAIRNMFYQFTESEGLSSESEEHKLGNVDNIKFVTSDDKIVNLISYETQEKVNLFLKVNELMLNEVSLNQLKNRIKRRENFELFTYRLGIHKNPIISIDYDEIPY